MWYETQNVFMKDSARRLCHLRIQLLLGKKYEEGMNGFSLFAFYECVQKTEKKQKTQT